MKIRNGRQIVAGFGLILFALALALIGILRKWSTRINSHEKLADCFVMLLILGSGGCFVGWLRMKDSQKRAKGLSVNAPGSIVAINGGVVSNSKVHNDYRQYGVAKPLPAVLSIHEKPISGLGQTRVTFRVDTPFVKPMFQVQCDKPCQGVDLLFLKNGDGSFGGEDPFHPTRDPSILLVDSGMKTLLQPDEIVQITVASRDRSALRIIKVEAYAS